MSLLSGPVSSAGDIAGAVTARHTDGGEEERKGPSPAPVCKQQVEPVQLVHNRPNDLVAQLLSLSGPTRPPPGLAANVPQIIGIPPAETGSVAVQRKVPKPKAPPVRRRAFSSTGAPIRPERPGVQLKAACEECTRSKVKCSGHQPCERCSARHTVCFYRPKRKRGPPPKSEREKRRARALREASSKGQGFSWGDQGSGRSGGRKRAPTKRAKKIASTQGGLCSSSFDAFKLSPEQQLAAAQVQAWALARARLQQGLQQKDHPPEDIEARLRALGQHVPSPPMGHVAMPMHLGIPKPLKPSVERPRNRAQGKDAGASTGGAAPAKESATALTAVRLGGGAPGVRRLEEVLRRYEPSLSPLSRWIWAVFFTMYKFHAEQSAAIWFACQLEKHRNFLMTQGATAGLSRLNRWLLALRIVEPRTKIRNELNRQVMSGEWPESGAEKGGFAGVSVGVAPQRQGPAWVGRAGPTKHRAVKPPSSPWYGLLTAEEMAMHYDPALPYLSIEETHASKSQTTVTVNEAFSVLFGHTADELAVMLAWTGGGFLPWGGDVLLHLFANPTDLLVYLDVIKLKFSTFGRPQMPSRREALSMHRFDMLCLDVDAAASLAKAAQPARSPIPSPDEAAGKNREEADEEKSASTDATALASTTTAPRVDGVGSASRSEPLGAISSSSSSALSSFTSSTSSTAPEIAEGMGTPAAANSKSADAAAQQQDGAQPVLPDVDKKLKAARSVVVECIHQEHYSSTGRRNVQLQIVFQPREWVCGPQNTKILASAHAMSSVLSSSSSLSSSSTTLGLRPNQAGRGCSIVAATNRARVLPGSSQSQLQPMTTDLPCSSASTLKMSGREGHGAKRKVGRLPPFMQRVSLESECGLGPDLTSSTMSSSVWSLGGPSGRRIRTGARASAAASAAAAAVTAAAAAASAAISQPVGHGAVSVPAVSELTLEQQQQHEYLARELEAQLGRAQMQATMALQAQARAQTQAQQMVMDANATARSVLPVLSAPGEALTTSVVASPVLGVQEPAQQPGTPQETQQQQLQQALVLNIQLLQAMRSSGTCDFAQEESKTGSKKIEGLRSAPAAAKAGAWQIEVPAQLSSQQGLQQQRRRRLQTSTQGVGRGGADHNHACFGGDGVSNMRATTAAAALSYASPPAPAQVLTLNPPSSHPAPTAPLSSMIAKFHGGAAAGPIEAGPVLVEGRRNNTVTRRGLTTKNNNNSENDDEKKRSVSHSSSV